MKSLVIVESPAKARTIKKYLGKDYEVKASVGHIKDLPKKKLGVKVEKGFEPEYITIRGKGKIIQELRDAAHKANRVYLAPDPDREGEAIAWHISQELKGVREEDIYRVLFNEITEQAIREAMKSPGKIDRNKVDAQQARRILDRLVGYQISPLLWEKVNYGLSAGRVQSVALRLVCEREREIQAFVPQEYWSITADLEGRLPPPFSARLAKIQGKKAEVKDEPTARAIVEEARGLPFVVAKVERKERKRNPVAPFITSQLQQEAARRLHFSPKRTMLIAQRLYEGIDIGQEGPVGLITYMRTDSPRISPQAQEQARDYIRAKFGASYLPARPPVYKGRASAQEAHEAIRPTSLQWEPENLRPFLGKEEFSLYQLIWQRFLASQMAPAVYDMTTVDITAGRYSFRASGAVIKFPGFMQVYTEGRDEPADETTEDGLMDREKVEPLPLLQVGEALKVREIVPRQHFTQPPPRYSEATLVKELEEKGVGRPSTYATIVSTIKDRDYVRDESRKLFPTELGMLVSDLLTGHFPEIVDVEFTANMENQLDEIEEGKARWTETLTRFYHSFVQTLERAQKEMTSVKGQEEPTDIPCEKCGRSMVIKWGRKGYFLACPGYPECKYTAEFTRDEQGTLQVVKKEEETTEEVCEKCGSPMLIKAGRYGKFLACSAYPQCKATRKLTAAGNGQAQEEATEEVCEKCGSPMLIKAGRYGKFLACSAYPQCKATRKLAAGNGQAKEEATEEVCKQ
ncbi:MAG: type I DNA topoisomerase [Candidatus Tectomicrobia bacterium]|uniref:DNA topoisomerase 1 n=1 Tax=Tectimicrobiota bacterium TaxID=2528274 RepID=A0A932CR19_UNCTE|nr:type I DNA topoisomerase [Candidatus Tectomicrobia bacterium]